MTTEFICFLIGVSEQGKRGAKQGAKPGKNRTMFFDKGVKKVKRNLFVVDRCSRAGMQPGKNRTMFSTRV